MRSILNTHFTRLALSLTFCFITSLSLSAERQPQPNILFILPDQKGVSHTIKKGSKGVSHNY